MISEVQSKRYILSLSINTICHNVITSFGKSFQKLGQSYTHNVYGDVFCLQHLRTKLRDAENKLLNTLTQEAKNPMSF